MSRWRVAPFRTNTGAIAGWNVERRVADPTPGWDGCAHVCAHATQNDALTCAQARQRGNWAGLKGGAA